MRHLKRSPVILTLSEAPSPERSAVILTLSEAKGKDLVPAATRSFGPMATTAALRMTAHGYGLTGAGYSRTGTGYSRTGPG